MSKDAIRHKITIQVIVDIIIWFSVALPVLFLFLQGTPNDRGFFCDDKSLSFPCSPDTLSTMLILVAGVAVSVLVIVLTEVLNCVDTKCRHKCVTTESIVYCVKSYGTFLTGFILQQLVVEVVKNRTGFQRPNFFDVCKPHFNTSLCPGYITNYTCTGDNIEEIRNSRQSFPSGHSSLSMYIAVFFCLYIENRLQISFSRVLKLFLQSGLIFVATLCGVDRILDNKHHPSDVVAGYILGAAVAVFMYYQVGRSFLKCDNTTERLKLKLSNTSCDCCAFGHSSEVEAQSPTPLLRNEDIDGLPNQNSTTAATNIFLAAPVKVRRHFSTPITPTSRSEDEV